MVFGYYPQQYPRPEEKPIRKGTKAGRRLLRVTEKGKAQIARWGTLSNLALRILNTYGDQGAVQEELLENISSKESTEESRLHLVSALRKGYIATESNLGVANRQFKEITELKLIPHTKRILRERTPRITPKRPKLRR